MHSHNEEEQIQTLFSMQNVFFEFEFNNIILVGDFNVHLDNILDTGNLKRKK